MVAVRTGKASRVCPGSHARGPTSTRADRGQWRVFARGSVRHGVSVRCFARRAGPRGRRPAPGRRTEPTLVDRVHDAPERCGLSQVWPAPPRHTNAAPATRPGPPSARTPSPPGGGRGPAGAGAGSIRKLCKAQRGAASGARGAGVLVGLDGCEVLLCHPCAQVRPCVPCLSRLPRCLVTGMNPAPTVSFYSCTGMNNNSQGWPRQPPSWPSWRFSSSRA